MSFSVDISRWVAKANGNADKVVRQVVNLAAQGVVMRSPVDTGRFRGNWNYSGTAPDTSTTVVVDPVGAATLASIAAKSAGLKAGGVAYVTNSLPYAQKLEYGLYPNPPKRPTGKTVNGFSRQAPNGMVRITVAGLPGAIRDYVAGLR